MKRIDFDKLEHGTYRIYWKSGGVSLAAIGMNAAGKNWLACCNWIAPATTDEVLKNVVRDISSAIMLEGAYEKYGALNG